jgi:hypothetical protein
MSAHNMRFVVVNDEAPRNPFACAACSRPLERGYLHDLSTSRRGGRVLWIAVSAFVGSVAAANAFDFAIAWPMLTVDVTSALFDSAWGDHRS